MNKAQNRIAVDLGATEAEGIYSNLSFINHSPSEFIVDFARLLPGTPKAKVYARVVMTPQATKALHRALGANIERFEKSFGEIQLQGPEGTAQVGFKPEE